MEFAYKIGAGSIMVGEILPSGRAAEEKLRLEAFGVNFGD